MRVLVTDGEQRSALAVVRSLGRAGHEVWVTGNRRRTLAASSRFCSRAFVLPDPLSRPGEFGDGILALTTTEGPDAVLPVTDPSLDVVLKRRAELEKEGSLVPFANSDVYTAISDKLELLERARALGIAIPRQVVVRCPESIPDVDPARLRRPIVVKPSRSVVGSGHGRAKTRIQYASDPDHLRRILREAHPASFPILLQERIEGPGLGVFLLTWDGEVVAAFGHRRLREKPPSGGVSVLRESRPLEPEILEDSACLLRAFGWRGPAMVEYKRDDRTGTPYLMEVNGRYWGSLQLAIDAGVDFPAIHIDVATGVRRHRRVDYPAGIRTRWLLGDIDHLIARVRRSRESLGLPPSAPGAGRAVLDFLLAFRPGIRNEIFRWSDPKPAVIEAIRWAGNAL